MAVCIINANPFYGKHHSEDSKKKISESKKGHQLSEEHKEKLRGHTAWNKGLKIKIVNGKRVYYREGE